MNNQQILEKAIQKAIDSGWNSELRDYGVYEADHGAWFDGRAGEYGEHVYPEDIPYELIFNHDFAKSLWGEELTHETFTVPKELNKRFVGTKSLDVKPMWQYFLQQMVIAEDPIKYLGENI